MIYMYVGDSRNVVKRIIMCHCNGNVEASALRKAIAEAMGYRLRKSRRKSGSVRVRIDLSNPNEGEAKISSYIRSGKWKYVVCHSYAEAHDFQWYAISQLKPLLNKRIKPWDTSRSERYQELFTQMLKSQPLGCNELYGRPTGPGVYLLLHQHAPSEFYRWLEEV